jgi:hypothetical protein
VRGGSELAECHPHVNWCRSSEDVVRREPWEVGYLTYQLHGNMLNMLSDKNLWKMALVEKAENRSKVVTLRWLKMGSWLRAASLEMEYTQRLLTP